MAIAVVQSKTFNSSGGSVTVTFTSTPSVGSFIGVNFAGNLSPAFSITDNQASGGNTYTQDISATRSGFTSVQFHSPNIQKASGTFTLTISGGVDRVWGCAYEVSGLVTSTPVIKTSGNTGALSGTGTTGNTAATTENNAFVMANTTLNNIGSATIETVSPAWTEDYNLGSFSGEGAHRIISTTGVQSCSWAITLGAGYAATIAVYSDAVTYTPPRITQDVQSIVAKLPAPPVFETQVVQTLALQGTERAFLTQVVQTLVLVNPVAPPPPGGGATPGLTPTNINAWKLLRFDLKKRNEEEA